MKKSCYIVYIETSDNARSVIMRFKKTAAGFQKALREASDAWAETGVPHFIGTEAVSQTPDDRSRITPSPNDLLALSDDQLRETLTTLNRPSLWKLVQDCMAAQKSLLYKIKVYRDDEACYQARLRQIKELAERNIYDEG